MFLTVADCDVQVFAVLFPVELLILTTSPGHGCALGYRDGREVAITDGIVTVAQDDKL